MWEKVEREGGVMNEKIWHDIFKKYIDDFRSINKLHAHDIIDEEEALKLKNKLLVNIVVTMESEVEQ